MKGLGSKERGILTGLAALERPVITADDVERSSSANRGAANLALSRLARKGWLRRLRRGLYMVVPLSSSSDHATIEDPLAAAMRLFEPCYISGWTAAEHWGLTEQVHNAVVVYSAMPQRRSIQLVAGVTYRVRRIKPEAIFGTTRLWSGAVPIEMADIHRTVIDVLDAPEMGGGGRQAVDIVRAYWARREADPRILLQMAKLLERGTVFKRLGFAMEKFGNVDERWLSECRKHLSAGVSLLDPAGARSGPIVTRWRLRVNVPIEDVS